MEGKTQVRNWEGTLAQNWGKLHPILIPDTGGIEATGHTQNQRHRKLKLACTFPRLAVSGRLIFSSKGEKLCIYGCVAQSSRWMAA